MLTRPAVAFLLALAVLAGACGGDDSQPTPTPAASPSASPQATPTPTATAVPADTATPAPSPTPTRVPTTTATPDPSTFPRAPIGFPVDPSMPVGLADYDQAGRPIEWGAGPTARVYSRDLQPGDDPRAANAGGWNCRVHVAFEGRPAVDWYIPEGTPIYATMDGIATLHAITTTNAFDHYGVDRAPYIGYPSDDAAVSPFPGPGGGKGVYVEIRNAGFVTESAHLELEATLDAVPDDALLPGITPGPQLVQAFAPMRGYLDSAPLARWEVRRGDLLGYSGDSGYSEAPHLHYTIRRADGDGLLCPTTEAGFADAGWLFR